MTVAGPSFFQIPQNKGQQCVNSGALSSLMISTVGITALVTEKTMGPWSVNAPLFMSQWGSSTAT
jgi:hypothetical protein